MQRNRGKQNNEKEKRSLKKIRDTKGAFHAKMCTIKDRNYMDLTEKRRRQWYPTPVLLPGKSHGWWNLVGYSPWGHKELDTTERLHFLSFFLFSELKMFSLGVGHYSITTITSSSRAPLLVTQGEIEMY